MDDAVFTTQSYYYLAILLFSSYFDDFTFTHLNHFAKTGGKLVYKGGRQERENKSFVAWLTKK